MSYSPGIYRSAGVLIKQYGKDAVAHARMRADHLLGMAMSWARCCGAPLWEP